MRDRTRSRSYSPEAERFRQEHARDRDWGLRQRHGLKLWRLRRERATAEIQTTLKITLKPAHGPTPSASPAPAAQRAQAERVIASAQQPPIPALAQTAGHSMQQQPSSSTPAQA